jgi:SAM-dependent methyltransferase
MTRVENLARLSGVRVTKFSYYYLHYKYLQKDLAEAISTHSTGKVLDIGCGNKPYRELFEGKSTSYTGCDIVQSDQKLVDVICEATNIPLPDESFDTLFSTQVIEHVADHQGLLKEAFRLLKPGGKIIASGPLIWPLHEEPYDFFRFTKYGFQYILEKAGFNVVKIFSNGGMWAVTGQSFLIAVLSQGKKCNFFIRAWRKLFIFFRMQLFVNFFYGWLDKADKNEVSTLNYVIVAQKPG